MRLRDKKPAILGGALLSLLLLATYSNHFQNSFHFDDAHTIVNNASIQSLKNIPRFFTDATTFSSLPSNQSYRPLVSTLFATDYKLGGLNPVVFHLSIFAIFLFLLLLLILLFKHLLDQAATSTANVWIAFAAAALYGLHPANADTVNYIIGSAEIIFTLGVVGSFAVYIAFPGLRRYFLFVIPAALAILAKPPAAIFPILFMAYCALFPRSDVPAEKIDQEAEVSRPPWATWKSPFLVWLPEVAPPFLICAAALLFVQAMTPKSWVAGAVSTHNYLITQPYVALLYFKTFFWPNDLSADYDLNPLTTTDDPRFWVGFVFVAVLVLTSIFCARFKSTRVIGFGLLWFIIALLPTSLFPLAEPLNDHRTFLPYIGLVIAVASAITVLLRLQIAQLHSIRIALCLVILFILSVSAYATFQRNKVWKTEETLWRDVSIKSPKNPRGLMNYGNTLMAKGDFNGALDHFHRALALAPQYSVLFVNLAIAEAATKHPALAEQHFKEALRLAPNSPDSYTFYARYLLDHSRAQEAEALVRRARALSPTDVTARDLLIRSERQQKSEALLALSLQKYNEKDYQGAIAAAQQALTLKPDYAEAWNNICAANNELGRFQDAVAACEQALRIKPDFDLARNNLQFGQAKQSDH